jgi:outer membrane autotransporter protein
VGGGSFTVSGIRPSRGAFTVDAGVDAEVGKRLAFNIDYGPTLPTGNYASQTVEAGLTYLF